MNAINENGFRKELEMKKRIAFFKFRRLLKRAKEGRAEKTGVFQALLVFEKTCAGDYLAERTSLEALQFCWDDVLSDEALYQEFCCSLKRSETLSRIALEQIAHHQVCSWQQLNPAVEMLCLVREKLFPQINSEAFHSIFEYGNAELRFIALRVASWSLHEIRRRSICKGAFGKAFRASLEKESAEDRLIELLKLPIKHFNSTGLGMKYSVVRFAMRGLELLPRELVSEMSHPVVRILWFATSVPGIRAPQSGALRASCMQYLSEVGLESPFVVSELIAIAIGREVNVRAEYVALLRKNQRTLELHLKEVFLQLCQTSMGKDLIEILLASLSRKSAIADGISDALVDPRIGDKLSDVVRGLIDCPHSELLLADVITKVLLEEALPVRAKVSILYLMPELPGGIEAHVNTITLLALSSDKSLSDAARRVLGESDLDSFEADDSGESQSAGLSFLEAVNC